MTVKPTKSIPLLLALLPITVLIALLVINVIIYGDSASGGPNQIALLMAAASAALVGWFLKFRFADMLAGINRSIGSALSAMIILLLIGSLIGTWMISGIVPAMIYYGLQVLNPKIFLFAAVLVCAIVSLATGSSWSTVGTVGVALLGIGQALGMSPAITAGAIISGAYFGDKISPLSDTTNLAAAMAGTELFTHIKYMLFTTVPSILITLGIFLAIGFSGDVSAPAGQTDALLQSIEAKFNLTPLLFVVPVIVLVMVFAKVDAVVALFVGAVLGGVLAIIFQPQVITTIANLPDTVVESNESGSAPVTRPPSYVKRSYVAFVNAMTYETSIVPDAVVENWQSELKQRQLASAQKQTGDPNLTWEQFETSGAELTESFPDLQGKIAAAGLMKGKGMIGMLNTIWLIICAMSFGGVMEACGFLQRITNSLIQFANSTGSLVATTAGSCLFVNVTASDQYLAIVVPGRMFRETFQDRGLAPENLSRTLEDAGTVTSVLVPWNTCGAFQAGTLGVATMAYAPFCFFNLISPLMTLFYAFLGLRIAKLKPETDAS
jgi:NhaC family Na+:H+ antiporter